MALPRHSALFGEGTRGSLGGTDTEHYISAIMLQALLQRISPALYFQWTPAIINLVQR